MSLKNETGTVLDEVGDKAMLSVRGRCRLLKKKIGLGNGSPMDGKKGGDDPDHRDHRLSTIEGGWDGGVQEIIKIIKMRALKNSFRSLDSTDFKK
jgi:hypothetical protein